MQPCRRSDDHEQIEARVRGRLPRTDPFKTAESLKGNDYAPPPIRAWGAPAGAPAPENGSSTAANGRASKPLRS